MCIGIPMEVVTVQGECDALCQNGAQTRLIDMRLVGQQPPGTWVLVFIDAAREVIDAAQAEKIQAALVAVDLAMQGGEGKAIEEMFKDLIDREPVNPFLG